MQFLTLFWDVSNSKHDPNKFPGSGGTSGGEDRAFGNHWTSRIPYELSSCEAGSFIPSTTAALRCQYMLLQTLPVHRLRFLGIILVTCLRLVHTLDTQGKVCRLLEIFGSPLSKGRRQTCRTQAFNPLLLHPHQPAVLWLAGLGHFFKGPTGKLGQA